MMKSTLIKDLYGEIERLKGGKFLSSSVTCLCRHLDVSCYAFCYLYLFLFLNLFDLLINPFVTLYTEVYAAREKNGVYIPKERYYQEESERKVLIFYCLSSRLIPCSFMFFNSIYFSNPSY